MSYTITRACLGILLMRVILLTAVIVSWSNADTSIALSSSGINVCGACNSNQELIYSCCEGWSQGIQDNDTCLTPVCDPPCDHGDCTSPDVCTCSVGFIGETCDIVSDKEYDSRLLHGTQSDRGIVQVRSTTGEWSLVNPDNWMRMNSHVICRQLGFSFAMSQYTGQWQFPEDSSPTLGVRFDCSGDEESLQNCDVTDLPQLEVQQNKLALQCGNGDPDRSSHACGSECNQDTFTRTGCKCDPLCKSYRDCCTDFSINTNCPDATSTMNVEETCTVIPLFHSGGQIPAHFQLGYFVVSTCSDSYRWDGDYINKMCEGETNLTDPVTFTPVQYTPPTGLRSTIYRNLYCAVCNQPDLLDPQQLEYVEAWKLETVGDFVIVGVRPPSLTDAPRSCYYMGTYIEPVVCELHVQIRENCMANYAPIFVNGRAYRNIFCAACDDVYPENRSIRFKLPVVADRPDGGCSRFDENYFVLRPAVSRPQPLPPLRVADLFTLFDILGDRGRQCQPGQIFDHFQQMCRIFSCSTGYRLDDEGTCKSIPVITEQPVFDESLGGNDSNDTLGCVQAVLLESVFGNNTDSPTVVPESALEITAYRNVLVVMVNDHTLSMVVINTLEAAMLLVSTNSTTYVNHVTSPLCNASTLVVTIMSALNDSDASNNTAHNVCSRNAVEFGVLTAEIDNHTHENIFQSDGILRMTSEYIWRADKGGYFLNVTTVVCRPGNEDCKEIKLGPDEYSFIVNSSSVLHEASGKILLEGEYRDGKNDTIHVCNSLLYNSNYFGPNTFETPLLWISFVFFILSLIATFATFLSYCVFRELRNITGQITMNFLFAFFVAQLMFILAPTLLIPKDLCISSAIINHFAWLGGFFWMNALSLVTTKTLTRKTVLLNKSNGMRFLAPYAVYAWGGPVLIVAVCVTLHFCDCTAIAPIYGIKNGAICWLVGHDGFASLWGFAAPVGVLLLFNTVLFVYAVVHFRRKISSARSTKKSKRLTLEATIYIKLTILMGLPWLLSFLQIFVTNIVLNYIYTILNSLQGVFVFMALVVTGRAGKLWRRKLMVSTTSSASGKSKPFMQSTMKTNTTSFTSSVSKTDPNTNGYGESSKSRVRSPVQSVSVGVTNDCRESSDGRVTSPVVESINAGFANDYCESFEGRVTSPVQSSSVGVSNDYREASEGRVTSPVVESTNAGVANDSSESSEDRATSPAQSISADVTNHRVRVMF